MKDIINLGVFDDKIDLFEGMYKVPDGVSYNSYLIKDDKIVVMDTVDGHFCDEWLENIERALGGAQPDYLVVQHMEPDHSACVKSFAEKYPGAKIVGNQKTFVMLGEYFGDGFPGNRLTVTDGEELYLGEHVLKFIFAPMVHWPEVMFTYDKACSVLFSADAFGRFGPLDANYAKAVDESRRYYIGIVGKYGVQVTSALGKVAGLDIKYVAPLHGPVLSGEKLAEMLSLYGLWSGYKPECDGVLVAYASVYGHTKAAAYLLKNQLENCGKEVKIVDLARDDWAECVAQAFRYSSLVVASPTYNATIFPAVREFIARLAERNYKNRFVGFIENGTWAPVTAKLMRAEFEKMNGITFAETVVKVRSALNADSEEQIKSLVGQLTK